MLDATDILQPTLIILNHRVYKVTPQPIHTHSAIKKGLLVCILQELLLKHSSFGFWGEQVVKVEGS